MLRPHPTQRATGNLRTLKVEEIVFSGEKNTNWLSNTKWIPTVLKNSLTMHVHRANRVHSWQTHS